MPWTSSVTLRCPTYVLSETNLADLNLLSNILMMKDQFNDFEELKVIAPVREEAIDLLQTIQRLNLSE